MVSKLFILSLTVLLGLAVNLPVSAAPFCVSSHGLTSECLYYDADQCRRRAQESSGLCSVNRAEVKFPRGAGTVCLIGIGGIAECIYPDVEACEKTAKKNKAICALNSSERSLLAPVQYNQNYSY